MSLVYDQQKNGTIRICELTLEVIFFFRINLKFKADGKTIPVFFWIRNGLYTLY